MVPPLRISPLDVVLGKLVPKLLGDILGIKVAGQGAHHNVSLVGVQVGVGEEVPALDELEVPRWRSAEPLLPQSG